MRQFIDKLANYDSNFTIIDEVSKKSILKEITVKERLNKQELQGFLNLISKWKNDFLYPNVDPQKLNQYYSYGLSCDTIFYYQKYQQYLEKSNAVDFDDLIALPIFLLHKIPACYHYLQNRWKYVLVDEYQDTNPTQEKLIENFRDMGSLLTVVGDNDQCIYGFRGSKVEHILDFARNYQPLKIIKLEQNYRSTQSILNIANDVIVNNQSLYPKKLFCQQGSGILPNYRLFFSEYQEAEWLTETICNYLSQGEQADNIAVLYRTNYQSLAIEQKLTEANIDYQIVGGVRFYQRKEIKDLLAYLNFIVNPLDRDSFKRLINFPARGIGNKTLADVLAYLDRHNFSILEAMQQENFQKLFSKNSLQQVKALWEWIVGMCQNIKQVGKGVTAETNLYELVYNVYLKSGIADYYQGLKDTFERDQRLGNLEAFLDYVAKQEKIKASKNLPELLEKISLNEDNAAHNEQQSNEEKKKVNLLTVHNAKGLEYDIVFIIGMMEDIFPHSISIAENEIEEERRLFYVAVTRAKYLLHISSTESFKNKILSTLKIYL